MNSPKVSAIVCTYNRSGFLRDCLQSLVEQTLDVRLFEVIIVNNNSTDDTQSVAERFTQGYDRFRVVLEPKQGLSNARNRGWREAEGRYVAFLDDDATACPTWLEKILWAFENVKPTPGCVGGQIDLTWEVSRPAWILDDMLAPLGRLDISDKPCLLKNEYLFGGNLAIPKALLEDIGGFNPNLGRGASDLMGNEEILLQQQVQQKGLPLYYHPEIFVWHMVHKARVRKSWFLQRRFWQGVSTVKTEELKSPVGIFFRLIKIMKSCQSVLFCLLKICFVLDTDVRMRLQYRMALQLGCLRGHFGCIWGIRKA
jgi:glycosyltransferase involved in cell wall biosynthesis